MSKKRATLFQSFIALSMLFACHATLAGEVTVYAAASLTNAVGEISKSFQASHPNVVIKNSFAASGSLAKQIEAGAPADIFISADSKWMDYLDKKGKIDHNSRLNLLTNTLVLIAPKGKGFAVRMEKGFDFAGAFRGKLCTGEIESVPVGIYAKQALISLGWWDAIWSRVVGTEDVRGALNLVERGECVGIVYETDAKLSDKVEIVAAFPPGSHAPIVYPAALMTANSEASEFFEYLKKSTEVFVRFGFTTPGK